MKYLLSQRYLLTTFFLTLFQMGGPFVVVAIASRFARNVYWRARQVAVVPIISYQRAFYNVFSYLQEISVLNAALVVFSYRSVNDMMFLDNNLFKYWSNFFISGMEARFANFFNWSNIMMRDRQRSPNKKRFNADIWSVHYKSVGEWQKNRDLAGIILHRYFFRRAVGLPKIIVSKFAVRRDFFLPVPAVATELVLSSF